MKKLLLILGFAGLMVSCEKDLPFGREGQDIDLKDQEADVAVFMVTPSGGDDTPAIYEAIMDAKAAGPGSVVQLCEGEYHLGLMEIRDFYGALKGAGQDKTIITVMNDIDLDPLWAQNLFPDLVKFVGGDVHISHLTIQTPPGAVSTGGPGLGHVTCLMSFTTGNAQYETYNAERSLNAVIDHVSFKGQYLEGGAAGYYYSYNCPFALRSGNDIRSADAGTLPRAKVDIKITNCDFDTFVYGAVIEELKNSKVVIGEKNNGNVFNNLEQGAGVWESRIMDVLVEGNTFNVPELCWGFDYNDYPFYPQLQDDPETTTSLCNIQNNVFNLNTADYAIYFRNQRHFTHPGEKPVAFQVKNNKFNMTDGHPIGIYSEVTKGAVIRNNKFSGYGWVGLYLTLYSQGGLVLGNNFSTAQFDGIALFLDSNTQDWTVVGGNLQESAIDRGVNNVITGMNMSEMGEPLGRAISDKITHMNHLMH